MKGLIYCVLCFFSFDAVANNCNRDNISPAFNYGKQIINSNSTVSDTSTGLMWARCSFGKSGESCQDGQINQLNWKDALKAANDSSLAGYNDWRLPNPKELFSIVDPQCMYPAINLEVFPDVPVTTAPFFYATSLGMYTYLQYDEDPRVSYAISFHVGGTYEINKNDNVLLVRFVRGGYGK